MRRKRQRPPPAPAEVPPPPAEEPPPPAEEPPPPAEEPPPPAEEPPPPAEDPPPPAEEPPPPEEEAPPADEPGDSPDDGSEGEAPAEEGTEDPTSESTEEPTIDTSEELTSEPTEESTEETDVEGDSTPDAEIEDDSDEDSRPATPTPTEEPDPVVTWSQSSPVDCGPTSAAFAGFDHMQTETYQCLASIEAQGEPEMPEGMSIQWSLEASFSDQLQLQLPSGSHGSVLSANQADGSDTRSMVVAMPWQNDSSSQSVEFELVVTRTVCEVGDNPITVQAVPTVENSNPEVEILVNGSTPERTIENAVYLPNLEPPTLSMQPIDFGSFEWDGESWGTSTVNSVITVANDGCATSQPYSVRIEITSSDPAMVPVVTNAGAESVLVGEVAGLANTPVTVATLPAGYAGIAELVVEFSLSPAEEAEPGDHSMTIRISIDSAP